MTDKILLTARNNAHWCDHVCRAHGIPTKWGVEAWRSLERAPKSYPDLVTLLPGPVDTAGAASLKDSFACLEPEGFELLFDAEWIWHGAPPRMSAKLDWRSEQQGEDVFVMTSDLGGCMLNVSDGVVGLSNVEGDVWPDVVAMISTCCPELPIVGYEHGDDLRQALAAGFEAIGPLRVWMKS